jgi:colicin import membrane protein
MKKEKVKKPFYKKWWFIGIVALFIIGIFMQPSEEEKAQIEAEEVAAQAKEEEVKKQKDEEKKAKEEAKKQEEEKKAAAEKEEKKKEEEERASLMVAFNLVTEDVIASSNGVITDITIADATNYFQVDVFVDETTWAVSNESEKMSFATTMGTSIENALSPYDTYVDIKSAANNDIVASQKLFGGWKIKR